MRPLLRPAPSPRAEAEAHGVVGSCGKHVDFARQRCLPVGEQSRIRAADPAALPIGLKPGPERQALRSQFGHGKSGGAQLAAERTVSHAQLAQHPHRQARKGTGRGTQRQLALPPPHQCAIGPGVEPGITPGGGGKAILQHPADLARPVNRHAPLRDRRGIRALSPKAPGIHRPAPTTGDARRRRRGRWQERRGLLAACAAAVQRRQPQGRCQRAPHRAAPQELVRGGEFRIHPRRKPAGEQREGAVAAPGQDKARAQRGRCGSRRLRLWQRVCLRGCGNQRPESVGDQPLGRGERALPHQRPSADPHRQHDRDHGERRAAGGNGRARPAHLRWPAAARPNCSGWRSWSVLSHAAARPPRVRA